MLAQEFNLKCFLDIALISSSPNAIYEILDQMYETSFQDRDRLVFYSSHGISDDLIQHVYEAANLVDISNYFILICSRYDASTTLERLCKIFSTDDVPLQTKIVDIDTTVQISDGFIMSPTLCPEPWTHLEIDNQGQIKPCCVSEQILGDVNHDDLHKIFHNTVMQDLRRQLLSGYQPSGCSKCWKLESLGLTSNRLQHLAVKKKRLMTSYLSTPRICSLDLKPGITCNFKCRICSSDASSLHAQELANYKKIPVVSHPDWIDNHADQILDLVPHLENLDLYGGEPFLMKKLTKLVQTIVQLDRASQVTLHYNSNGSVFPDFLLPYWKHFQHVDIHFSIDNLGNKFEIERGGMWKQTEKNIIDLLSLNLVNVKISIMPTVNIMNVYYLDELLDWADALNIPVNFNILSDPECLAISALTEAAKEMILEKYRYNSHAKIRQISNAVRASPTSDGRSFVEFMQRYDRLRQERFSHTHKEIAIAMGFKDISCFGVVEENIQCT